MHIEVKVGGKNANGKSGQKVRGGVDPGLAIDGESQDNAYAYGGSSSFKYSKSTGNWRPSRNRYSDASSDDIVVHVAGGDRDVDLWGSEDSISGWGATEAADNRYIGGGFGSAGGYEFENAK